MGREEGLPLGGIPQCLQILLVVTPKGKGTYNEYQPLLLLNILQCAGKPLQQRITQPQMSTKKKWKWKLLSRVWVFTVGGILQARILEWVAFLFSRGSSQPRYQAKVSTLQADSLPAEPPGKPKDTGVGSLSLLQGIFLTQESNQGLLHCKWILYQLSYQRILVARKRAATDHLLPACRKSLTHFFCVFFVNE